MQKEVNMSEDFSIERLREEVNPVYSTAHSCLQIVERADSAISG